MAKIKINQLRPQKKIGDLHNSGSFLGAISKCLTFFKIVPLFNQVG
jgi:hypothetical protein